MMGRHLLTIREAAELLNISVPTLRRMVWAGEISYIDINKGGRHMMVRFTTKHIEDFLREREVQAG
jgi:excisionase family DNA binding protein